MATNGEDSELQIAEVLVSVGQQVQEGDVLYTLVEEKVQDLADELEANVTRAKADLDALLADQELSKVTAKNTYDSSIAYGSYAELEKNTTIASLESAVKEKQTALATAEKNIATVQYCADTIKNIIDIIAGGNTTISSYAKLLFFTCYIL